jgi:hypothetical protein
MSRMACSKSKSSSCSGGATSTKKNAGHSPFAGKSLPNAPSRRAVSSRRSLVAKVGRWPSIDLGPPISDLDPSRPARPWHYPLNVGRSALRVERSLPLLPPRHPGGRSAATPTACAFRPPPLPRPTFSPAVLPRFSGRVSPPAPQFRGKDASSYKNG